MDIFTENGQQKLGGSDFELDLANPIGPLAGLVSNGEVTLLIESSYFPGRSEARLVIRFENGQISIEDELWFHIINVDFEEVSQWTGYDDNGEGIPPNPALMVASGSSNTVRVKVYPSSLFSQVELIMNGANATVNSSNLISGNHIAEISGLSSGEAQLIAKFKNVGVEGARMFIDVKNRRPGIEGTAPPIDRTL